MKMRVGHRGVGLFLGGWVAFNVGCGSAAVPSATGGAHDGVGPLRPLKVAHGSARPRQPSGDGRVQWVQVEPRVVTASEVVDLTPAPEPLQSAIQDHGPKLPVTMSHATAAAFVDAVHVVALGGLTTTVGPFALRASTFGQGNTLTFVVALAPLPNARFASGNVRHAATATITHVFDQQGNELLDPNSIFASDTFSKLKLSAEPDAFAGPEARGNLTVTGYAPPHEASFLFASRQIGVSRPVTLQEVASIEGVVEASLPLDVAMHTLRNGQLRASSSGCNVTLSLSEGDSRTSLTIQGATDRYVDHVAFDHTGEAIEPERYSASAADGEQSIEVTSKYGRPIDHVIVAVAPTSLNLRYAFTLTHSTSPVSTSPIPSPVSQAGNR